LNLATSSQIILFLDDSLSSVLEFMLKLLL